MSRRRKIAAMIIVLVALHMCVLFAGFMVPYDAAAQNREMPFVPPMRPHFIDASGHFHSRPFVYLWKVREGTFDSYEEDRGQMWPLRFMVPGTPYKIASFLPARTHLFGIDSPGQVYLFGSDGFGRDLFSRTLYGGQISLLAGLLAAGLTLAVGTILGGLSGFYGGWVDEIIMRGAELFMALPWLYLLFAIRAFLPLQMDPQKTLFLLIAVIGLVGWARPARLIRGVVLSARERDFVRAARGFGATDLYILRRHVLPQAGSVILTQATLLIPQYVLAEITLSFLGLGIGEPVPTWGNMLSAVMQVHVLQSYWWMIAPGLASIPFFLGYMALGSALNDGQKLGET